MLDPTLRMLYRIGRKATRESRCRMPGLYRAWDLAHLKPVLCRRDPRDLLLDYAALAPWASEGGSRPPVDAWADDDEARAIVARADQGCSHVFDLLGSGPCPLGAEIDWHRDFKSGHRWSPADHHLRIRWDDVPDGTDIKVPWELSRCQHFATFGLADWITGDQKYYHEFKDQVAQWLTANPCGFGVNWVCAMDVAIRAVNWLEAVMLFRHRLEADDDPGFCAALVESLWLHGCHLARNLEWQGPRTATLNNHFLADLTGLLALGVFFSGSRAGRRHRAFARRWLEREIRSQVFDDGANFETSTSYHRLACEMFLWTDGLARRTGEPFSGGYRDRLAAMVAFVAAYASPSGVAAQFGDNDSGRLLAAGIDDGRDHLYLADRACGFGGRANRLLLHGGAHHTRGAGTSDGHRESTPSLVGTFPRGGYWFARCGPAWLGIRAGVVSHGGAHAHCDQLSFVLAVGGDDFLVDPGTGVYSADTAKRNRYRATAAHNACRINHWEANTFRDGKPGLFRMGDDTQSEVLEWRGDRAAVRFRGLHHGYERHRPGLVYQRCLVLRADGLEITDRFVELAAGDLLEWTFPFAPGVKVNTADGLVEASAGSSRLRLEAPPGVELEITEASHSPAYGVERPAARLSVRASVVVPGSCEYTIRIAWGEPAIAGHSS